MTAAYENNTRRDLSMPRKIVWVFVDKLYLTEVLQAYNPCYHFHVLLQQLFWHTLYKQRLLFPARQALQNDSLDELARDALLQNAASLRVLPGTPLQGVCAQLSQRA